MSTHDHDGAGGVGRDGRGHRAQAGGGRSHRGRGCRRRRGPRVRDICTRTWAAAPVSTTDRRGHRSRPGRRSAGAPAWNSPHVRRSACRVIKARAAAAGLPLPHRLEQRRDPALRVVAHGWGAHPPRRLQSSRSSRASAAVTIECGSSSSTTHPASSRALAAWRTPCRTWGAVPCPPGSRTTATRMGPGGCGRRSGTGTVQGSRQAGAGQHLEGGAEVGHAARQRTVHPRELHPDRRVDRRHGRRVRDAAERRLQCGDPAALGGPAE